MTDVNTLEAGGGIFVENFRYLARKSDVFCVAKNS